MFCPECKRDTNLVFHECPRCKIDVCGNCLIAIGGMLINDPNAFLCRTCFKAYTSEKPQPL